MPNLKILNSKEKKEILKILKDQFGFTRKLDYVFLMNKKNKLYVVTPEISKVDFDRLRVNSFGIYFGELYRESLRLSLEGSQIIGPRASKNVVLLSDADLEQWVKGLDMATTEDHEGFVLVAHHKDFYASGKTKNGKLLNYLPKARSLRVVNE